MKNNSLNVFLVFVFAGYLFSCSYVFGQIKQTQSFADNLLSPQNVIKLIYEEINEGEIHRTEAEFIMDEGGAPVYGEITFQGATQLLETLQLTEKDVFYDLGSGLGKLVIQCYLTTRVQQAFGVELSKTRYQRAQRALSRMKRADMLDPLRHIKFINNNIVQMDLNNATVVFTCSTCFSSELLNLLKERLQKLPSLRMIASLRKLPSLKGFFLFKELDLPMTWCDKVPVYIYVKNR